MLTLHLTRDSVCAGDDTDAPHELHLKVAKASSALDVVKEVLRQGYLPSISGGRASWVVSSREPFAVCAQEWAEPKTWGMPKPIDWLARAGNELRLHFSYLAQIIPDNVLEVLSRCTFSAIDDR